MTLKTWITAAALAIFGTASSAAVITYDIVWDTVGGAPDPAEINFTLDTDLLDLSGGEETVGFTLNSTNLALDSSVAYTSAGPDDIIIGGTLDGVGQTIGDNNDFFLILNDFSDPDAASVSFFSIRQTDGVGEDIGFPDGSLVSITGTVAAVPLPAGGVLLLTALGAGLALRRRSPS